MSSDFILLAELFDLFDPFDAFEPEEPEDAPLFFCECSDLALCRLLLEVELLLVDEES